MKHKFQIKYTLKKGSVKKITKKQNIYKPKTNSFELRNKVCFKKNNINKKKNSNKVKLLCLKIPVFSKLIHRNVYLWHFIEKTLQK